MDDSKQSRLTRTLKIIGAVSVSAVISLLLALNQVTGVVQKFRVHHREFSDAMQAGNRQFDRGDYPGAFDSFKRAAELDPIDRDAQKHQAKAAMLWLDNIHVQKGTFSDTVTQVMPVLDRALNASKGAEAADLQAHIGWANFLRYRDTGSTDGLSIDQNYQQALNTDPQNVYAHTMWGHWILWKNGDLAAAKQHFAAALSGGRIRDYVRHMQLSALNNSHSPGVKAEAFRVANDMRRGGEKIDPVDRRRTFDETIVFELHEPEELAHILRAIPAEDALATYDWLAESASAAETYNRQRRAFVVAFLAEVGGRKDEALSRYRALGADARKTNTTFGYEVNAALARLSAKEK